MDEAISDCAQEAGWRIHSILRSRRYHTDSEIVGLYKAHVLSYIEYRTPAIAHSSSSALSLLDNVQSRFLRSLHISDFESL